MGQPLPFPDYPTAEIQKIADTAREEHASGELPVDVLAVVEFDLGIEIRPVRDLKEVYGMDALLMSSMDVICVDEFELMHDYMANRLRFSIAHELGHWYLHRSYYESRGISDLKEAYDFIGQLTEPQYDQLEWQASEFAGRFLVEPGRLTLEAQKYFDEFKEELEPLNLPVEVVLDQIVARLAPKFSVSESVLTRRIQREKIAPNINWPG